jgi:hypothetical protein
VIHIVIGRLRKMLSNAIESAKTAQGRDKPHPYVMMTERDGLLVAGAGQWSFVEDHEPMESGTGSAAIRLDEALLVDEALKDHPDSLKKSAVVAVSFDDDILRVQDGSETLVEIRDVGDEAAGAWNVRRTAMQLRGETPPAPAERIAVYSASVIGLLGKLKTASGDDRLVLYPNAAGNSTLFRMGSVWGWLEGNRTDPAEV